MVQRQMQLLISVVTKLLPLPTLYKTMHYYKYFVQLQQVFKVYMKCKT